ncbi:MAG TPA: L,D-transpeptidase family protein [Streptosporangiaceae bacterium]|nr:L,D-transpeptidase family protein [Streptosporangiaceae bacterium]
MRHSVWRWLFCTGAVAAVGVAACAQLGTANAARVATGARQATAAHQVKAAATYVPPGQDFNFGARGAAVRSVQRRLNQLHYYAGKADGVYGQDTAEAVWAFKEAQGLPLNAATNTLVTYKFRRDLIHPRMPRVLVPKGGRNRIEINQNDELLVLYRDNEVRLILHVSSGGGYTYPCPGDPSATCGPAITPDGNYKALSFAPGWVQVPLGTMYNPVFFIGTAYAIHGDIPVPWYPASHGCVRIWMDAANWFHKDVTIGGRHATRIYVRGTAPYYL